MPSKLEAKSQHPRTLHGGARKENDVMNAASPLGQALDISRVSSQGPVWSWEEEQMPRPPVRFRGASKRGSLNSDRQFARMRAVAWGSPDDPIEIGNGEWHNVLSYSLTLYGLSLSRCIGTLLYRSAQPESIRHCSLANLESYCQTRSQTCLLLR